MQICCNNRCNTGLEDKFLQRDDVRAFVCPRWCEKDRNAVRSAGRDARNGEPERRIDANLWRCSATASTYSSSLARRSYRSVVKILPDPCPNFQRPSSGHNGRWSTDQKPPFRSAGSGVAGAGYFISKDLTTGVGVLALWAVAECQITMLCPPLISSEAPLTKPASFEAR